MKWITFNKFSHEFKYMNAKHFYLCGHLSCILEAVEYLWILHNINSVIHTQHTQLSFWFRSFCFRQFPCPVKVTLGSHCRTEPVQSLHILFRTISRITKDMEEAFCLFSSGEQSFFEYEVEEEKGIRWLIQHFVCCLFVCLPAPSPGMYLGPEKEDAF